MLVYNGREIRTILALEEHGEKLQIALVIREQLYSKYQFIYLFLNVFYFLKVYNLIIFKRNSDFINMAIEHITKNREESTTKLYPHDLFYRRVSIFLI